jgi:hypothetical protein
LGTPATFGLETRSTSLFETPNVAVRAVVGVWTLLYRFQPPFLAARELIGGWNRFECPPPTA